MLTSGMSWQVVQNLCSMTQHRSAEVCIRNNEGYFNIIGAASTAASGIQKGGDVVASGVSKGGSDVKSGVCKGGKWFD